MLVGTHVARNARRWPQKTALAEGDYRLSYGELDRLSNRIARALQRAGIGHGGKVAILSDARVSWVAAYVGIVKLGAVAVPCNYRQRPEDILHTIEDSESRLVFVAPAFRPLLSDQKQNQAAASRQVVLDGEGREGLADFIQGCSEEPLEVPLRSGDANVILYTGGTTGKSKGVVLSHGNLFWNSLNEIADTHMREDDNTLLATPLHHSAALNCWLLPHLYLGATATLLRKYSAEAMLRTVARAGITNAFTPPSMARELFAHPLAKELDLRSFRRWYIGGGILPRQDRDQIHALLPGVSIYYQYGLTEAGPIVTVLKEEDYEKAPLSIGRSFLNIETKILRQDLTDAPPGEVGEIAVRGPSVMKEYYKRPEATAQAFAGGWLRTGDLGAIDENGFVSFHDRLKDMIKTGGMNVYSQEVERVLAAHPAVREVAVLGVASEKWGEEVTAVVVLRDGEYADEKALLAHARKTLAGYQVPKRVLFLPYGKLPINYSGKILKRELRERLG